MSLKADLTEAVKTAMRARDKRRLGALRLITAAVKQREVDERVDLNDAAVIGIMDKMRKQCQDALRQFEEAGRTDLADQEAFEIGLLDEFMPTPISAEELDELLESTIAESGAVSMRDMGKVMGILKPKLQGRADLGAISARIKERLTANG